MKAFVATSLFALVAISSCEPPAPRNQYLPPGQHGAGGFGGFGGSGSGHQHAPSSAYGAPAITSAVFTNPQTQYGAPSGHGSGAGNGGYGFGGGYQEENYGPAKYDFQYDVQDYSTGQDFGHMESRDGDKTVGRYYVLLPDGRKQVVKYEADEHGYRPVVSYEDTGAGHSGLGGGYDRNAQSHGGFNGY